MRKSLTFILAALGLWTLCGSPGALAAVTPAGSTLENQAAANFTDPDAGVQSVLSNKVITTLSAVCAVSVSPKDQLSSYQSGGTVLYSFKVSNGGNGPYTFALGVQNSFAATFSRIYQDFAPLGVKSANDVLITSPEQIALLTNAAQDLLLEVGIPGAVSGELTSTLTASCPNGGPVSSGVGRARQGAKLELFKSFSRSSVQPGDTVTVTLSLLNSGEFEARNIVVDDLWQNTLGADNFTLVPGSVNPTAGLETVSGGLRWRVPALARKGALSFSFDLRMNEQAQLGTRTNVATAAGQDGGNVPLPPVQAQAPITLRAAPQIALGPQNNPRANPGGEGSPDDRQTRDSSLIGVEVCFEHALENRGPDPDFLSVALDATLSGSVSATFKTLSGGLQSFPVNVQSGSVFRFLACYTPLTPQPFEVRLKATSSLGAKPNLTTDALLKVIAPGVALGPINLPEAPEGSELDSQTQASAILNRPICFEHTVKNTGNSTDTFTFSSVVVVGAATVDLQGPNTVTLEPGQSYTFKICYTPTQGGPLEVRLSATSSFGPVNSTVDKVTEVLIPQIALGPVNNPRANPGGEGSASDLQQKENALLNQAICFDHTLENLGKSEDSLGVTGALTAGTGTLGFFNLNGTPLTFPVALKPQGQDGDEFSFRVCYTLSAAGTGANALEATLTATSGLGAVQNLTRDRVKKLFAGLPTLEKTVDVGSGKPVKQGETLTYTLKISNPFPFALSGITLRDVLDPNLDLSSVVLSNGGKLEGNTAVWTFDTLEANTTLTLNVSAKVKTDAPDGVQIKNRFTFVGDEVPTPTPSNEVTTLIWSASLTLEKQADVAQVDIGGELGWTLRIFNTSKNAALVQLMLEDTLPLGLSYIPGTAKLNGVVLPDPSVNGQKLSFSLPDPIQAGATVVLTFRTRVGVGAPELLINAAQVSGKGQDAATSNLTAVASNVARSQTVRINPRIFGARGELLGRVYLDVNGDGAFSFAQDLPQKGVRLILADGRSVLTDTEGRYHFQSLPEGMWGLRLDPNSVPYRAAPEVHDGGKRGSRNMNVFALTVSDFPLELPVGSVYACRTTTLRVGEVALEKVIVRLTPNTYRVTLTLSTPLELAALNITDPLPPGSQLLEGVNTFKGDVNAGTRTFVYTFTLRGDGLSTLTDPEMGWSYP